MEQNKHLNLFYFFNGSEKQFIEDNLSRAFALCLKHDPLFLNSVLNHVMLQKDLDGLFLNEHASDEFDIGIQRVAQDFGTYSKVIGVACSVQELSMEDMDSIKPKKGNKPIVDVWLTKDDLCIVFEFKRAAIDCKSQLKQQVKSIIEDQENVDMYYEDYNWGKIVKYNS